MKTKLLRKLTANVRFEEKEIDGKTMYQVYQKNFKGEWERLISTNRIHRALHRRHNALLCHLHCIGKTGALLDRRKKRKAKK